MKEDMKESIDKPIMSKKNWTRTGHNANRVLPYTSFLRKYPLFPENIGKLSFFS